jgi:hypothetical protein
MAGKVFESPFQWNMYCSAGRSCLGGNFLRPFHRSGGKKLILAETSITNSWLDRTSDTTSFHKLHKEFMVTLSQVIMSRDRVESLIDALRGWLDSSNQVHVDLCPDEPDQNLAFYLAPPKAEGSESAAFEVRYSGTDFRDGAWSFSVDQSCVRIFADELANSLYSLGRSA